MLLVDLDVVGGPIVSSFNLKSLIKCSLPVKPFQDFLNVRELVVRGQDIIHAPRRFDDVVRLLIIVNISDCDVLVFGVEIDLFSFQDKLRRLSFKELLVGGGVVV